MFSKASTSWGESILDHGSCGGWSQTFHYIFPRLGPNTCWVPGRFALHDLMRSPVHKTPRLSSPFKTLLASLAPLFGRDPLNSGSQLVLELRSCDGGHLLLSQVAPLEIWSSFGQSWGVHLCCGSRNLSSIGIVLSAWLEFGSALAAPVLQ